MQVTPSSRQSAIRTGGSPPRAMPCAHACRRALFTAAVILRVLRSQPAAVSLSARHAVGADATGPSSSHAGQFVALRFACQERFKVVFGD